VDGMSLMTRILPTRRLAEMAMADDLNDLG
jgi:hypothetical protein